MLDAEPVAAPPRPREALAPLAPARYKLQLTIGEQTHDKLRRVQDLLRHSIPTGDLAAIFNRALTLLLAEVERRKLASTDQPRQRQPLNTRSRHVPASVKRVVWSRDGGRCAFVGSGGRCTETGFLEFHHVDPYATGGETTTANLQLRCRAHNQYEADEFFGFGLPVVREGPSLYAVA